MAKENTLYKLQRQFSYVRINVHKTITFRNFKVLNIKKDLPKSF